MRFFITGAGGFIGSNVVKVLLSAGHTVAYLRRPGSNSSRLGYLDLIPIDVDDDKSKFRPEEQEKLNEFCPDAVVHLGWIGVGNGARNNSEQLENISMSINVLTAASKAGARHFIGFGSQAEYGPCEGKISEQQTLRPTTVYGAAKASAGIITEVLAKQLAMEFSWIRVFSTYGPGDAPYWMIQDVASKLIRGQVPELTLGTQKWDYLFVEDAARAVCAVSASPYGLGTVNLGSGSAPSIREIVEVLRNIISPDIELDFGAVPFREDQVMHLEADISKLCSETGWMPIVSLPEGLSRTVEHLKKVQNDNRVK